MPKVLSFYRHHWLLLFNVRSRDIVIVFNRLVHRRSELKCVRDISHVRVAKLSSHTKFIQVFLDVGLRCILVVCNLLFANQVVVAFDLLSQISICYPKLVHSHRVFFHLKLDFLQLVNGQVTFFLNILVHLPFVKHVDPVLFLSFLGLSCHTCYLLTLCTGL